MSWRVELGWSSKNGNSGLEKCQIISHGHTIFENGRWVRNKNLFVNIVNSLAPMASLEMQIGPLDEISSAIGDRFTHGVHKIVPNPAIVKNFKSKIGSGVPRETISAEVPGFAHVCLKCVLSEFCQDNTVNIVDRL